MHVIDRNRPQIRLAHVTREVQPTRLHLMHCRQAGCRFVASARRDGAVLMALASHLTGPAHRPTDDEPEAA